MPAYIENILLLLGTTVGAGIFSLPLTLHQAGAVGYILVTILIAILISRINTYYREIVDIVKTKHQLSGYVKIIMGERMSRIAAFLLFISTCGALLAYLILGGSFLSQVVHVRHETASYIFFGIVAIIIAVGRKRMEMFDSAITVIKIVMLAVVILFALSHFSFTSLSKVPVMGSDPFVAYGTILFAMTGISIIPELKRDSRMRGSILGSQLIVSVLYICFAFSFFPYLKGEQLSLSTGLETMIFDITGFITVLTPYLLLSYVGYDFFVRDFRFNEKDSTLLILLIPLVLFLFGFTSFIEVISLTGGVFLGSIAFIICLMYRRRFPGKHVLSTYIIQFIFLAGMILQILRFVMPF